MNRNVRSSDHESRQGADKRYSCPPEQLASLIQRAQQGDASAEHELYRQLTPMLSATAACYHRDSELYEELEDELYLILRRLVLKFDPQREVNVYTYLDRHLGKAVWSFVRQRRKVTRRELPWSNLPAGDTDDEGGTGTVPEAAINQLVRRECGWLAQNSSVEEVVVIRIAIKQAVESLPQRQSQVATLRIDGYSFEEIGEKLGTTAANCRKAFQCVRVRLRETLKKVSSERLTKCDSGSTTIYCRLKRLRARTRRDSRS